MDEAGQGTGLTGEKLEECFDISASLLANLMLGRVMPARALCDQLDAALARIDSAQKF